MATSVWEGHVSTAKYSRLNTRPTHYCFRVPKGLLAGRKHKLSHTLFEESCNTIKFIIAMEGQTLKSLTFSNFFLKYYTLYFSVTNVIYNTKKIHQKKKIKGSS